nr:hypothetical protein [Tanacetum cinerariifolium]
MSAKRTSWNEFSSAMASAVICLSTGVETPLFEGMLVGVIEEEGDTEEQVKDVDADTVAQGADTAAIGDVVQDQSITSPTSPPQQPQDLPSTSQANKVKVLKLRRLKKVGASQRIASSDDTVMKDASNQGRIIDALDSDAGVALMDDKEEGKKAEEAKVVGDNQVKGRQAKIYKIDMDHALKVLSVQEDEPKVQEVVDVVTTAKLITEVVTAASESVTAASTTIVATEPQVPDATVTAALDVAIDHVKQKAKEDPFVQRYQVMKKRPQTEAQARRNMIMYLKNLEKRVKKLERVNKVKILKLRRLKKVRTSQRIESSANTDMDDASNQGRMIADLDRDTRVALMDDEGTKKKAEDAQVAGDEQVKRRQAEI